MNAGTCHIVSLSDVSSEYMNTNKPIQETLFSEVIYKMSSTGWRQGGAKKLGKYLFINT